MDAELPTRRSFPLWLGHLLAFALLILLVLLMITPVFYGIKVWIQVLGAQEITID